MLSILFFVVVYCTVQYMHVYRFRGGISFFIYYFQTQGGSKNAKKKKKKEKSTSLDDLVFPLWHEIIIRV